MQGLRPAAQLPQQPRSGGELLGADSARAIPVQGAVAPSKLPE